MTDETTKVDDILIHKEMYDLLLDNLERFEVLLEAGVFSLAEGKAEINCHNGQIQTVNVNKRTYKRVVENGKIPI